MPPIADEISDSALRMTNISLTFADGTQALDNLNLNIQSGEFVTVVGPSGCGKSTLLYLLGLLDRPDGGEIEINGSLMSNHDDLARTAARGEHIGFVFQFHFLMLEFTALENVMMPMRKLGRLTAPEMEARARMLLEAVGLGAKTHRLGTQLSGGEQQRVALARAFMNRPKILFCDEPTGNLDGDTAHAMADLIFRLNEEKGTTLVLVTHDLELARRCRRILRLKAGAVASDETV